MVYSNTKTICRLCMGFGGRELISLPTFLLRKKEVELYLLLFAYLTAPLSVDSHTVAFPKLPSPFQKPGSATPLSTTD